MKEIVIIGGGIASLTCALQLNKYGFAVTVIEKKRYPFHRVCGEYVSNEVLPFYKSLQIDFSALEPSCISKLALSSAGGKLFEANLDLGGFGLSRYALDNFLYQEAEKRGVHFIFDEKVNDVSFKEGKHEISLSDRVLYADLAIGAYGKRSNLDARLNRSFFQRRSPYLGVKYHIRTDFPADTIQLDIFKGGYCGIVKIEGDRYCLCYLSENEHLKRYGGIEALENEVLFKNPRIRSHFRNADFLFDKPETINEISFENKSLVEDHILFCGDSAGMITPLCGNGMAIAAHSAKILADAIAACPDLQSPALRTQLEQNYTSVWRAQFARRLKAGRALQRLFKSEALTELAISVSSKSQRLTKYLISKTHGDLF